MLRLPKNASLAGLSYWNRKDRFTKRSICSLLFHGANGLPRGHPTHPHEPLGRCSRKTVALYVSPHQLWGAVCQGRPNASVRHNNNRLPQASSQKRPSPCAPKQKYRQLRRLLLPAVPLVCQRPASTSLVALGLQTRLSDAPGSVGAAIASGSRPLSRQTIRHKVQPQGTDIPVCTSPIAQNATLLLPGWKGDQASSWSHRHAVISRSLDLSEVVRENASKPAILSVTRPLTASH